MVKSYEIEAKLDIKEYKSSSKTGSEDYNKNHVITAEVKTTGGTQTASLIPEPTILDWLSKDN